MEIAGARNSNAIDYTSYAAATGGGGSSNPVAVTGNTPEANNNLWIAAMSLGGGGSDAGIATPAGWTVFNLFNDFDAVAAGEADFKDDATGSPQSASWSNNTTTSNYAAAIVAIKNTEAPSTTVEGEGEIALIANKNNTNSIWLNPNDLTSMIKSRYAVVPVADEHPAVAGDLVSIRLSKTHMGGLTAASYMATLPNRINNGTFDSAAGWTTTGTVSIGSGVATFSGAYCCQPSVR